MKLEEEKLFKNYERMCEDGDHPFQNHEKEEPYLTELIQFLKNWKSNQNLNSTILIQQLEFFNLELMEHAWIEENILSSIAQKNITQSIQKHLNS